MIVRIVSTVKFPWAFSNITKRPLFHLSRGDAFLTAKLTRLHFAVEIKIPKNCTFQCPQCNPQIDEEGFHHNVTNDHSIASQKRKGCDFSCVELQNIFMRSLRRSSVDTISFMFHNMFLLIFSFPALTIFAQHHLATYASIKISQTDANFLS